MIGRQGAIVGDGCFTWSVGVAGGRRVGAPCWRDLRSCYGWPSTAATRGAADAVVLIAATAT